MIDPHTAQRNFPTSLLACLGLVTALTLLLDNRAARSHNITSLIAQNPPATQAAPQTTLLYVNPTMGNDGSGNGSEQAPFKTITHALEMAGTDTVILLAPGTYSPETGESFPIELKAGVIIQGDPGSKGRNVAIRGGGMYLSRTFARQNIAILGANGAGLAGVTVTNPNRRGYGLWIESTSMVVADNTFTGNTHDGISVTGNGGPLIRNNYFVDNGANGITIFNNARPEVRENLFERTGFAIAIAQNSAPLLIGNRITQNQDGIVVYGKAQPVLRNNSIEGNTRDGLVAAQECRPDMGTEGQPGANVFRNNRRYDINTTAANQTILAVGNQIAKERIAGRLDLGAGVVVNRVARENNVQLPRVSTPTSVEIPVPPPVRATASSNRTTGRRRVRRRRAVSRRRNLSQLPPPPPLPRVTVPPIPPETLQIPNVRQAPPAAITSSRAFQQPNNVRQVPSSAAQRVALPARIPNRVLPVIPPNDRLPDISVQPGALPGEGQMPNLPRVEIPATPRAVGEPLPSNSTAAVGQGYRVVVLVETLNQETLLRQLVPDAIRLRSVNSILMQVGVYSDRTSAEQMWQRMSGNGFNATIEAL